MLSVVDSQDNSKRGETKHVDQPSTDLLYEDVVVGQELETAGHTLGQADIMKFAEVTLDHHPLHTDPDYCRDTEYGQTIAHGLFGLSLMEGLKSQLKLFEHTSLASLGWDKVKFMKPIFAGDTVHVRMSFSHKRPSRKSDRGVVTELVQLVNQSGEVVTEAEHVTLLMRRGEDS